MDEIISDVFKPPSSSQKEVSLKIPEYGQDEIKGNILVGRPDIRPSDKLLNADIYFGSKENKKTTLCRFTATDPEQGILDMDLFNNVTVDGKKVHGILPILSQKPEAVQKMQETFTQIGNEMALRVKTAEPTATSFKLRILVDPSGDSASNNQCVETAATILNVPRDSIKPITTEEEDEVVNMTLTRDTGMLMVDIPLNRFANRSN